jgi:signal transduction histidine kinase
MRASRPESGVTLLEIADHLSEAVLVTSPDGLIVFSNRKAEMLAGRQLTGAPGVPLDQVPFDPQTRRHLARKRKPWVAEGTLGTPEVDVVVRVAGWPMLKNGRRGGSLLLVTDLGEVPRAIADRDRALQNDRAKTRSLHMVAHDLSGPLTVLKGYVSLVQDGSIRVEALGPRIPVLAKQLSHMQRLVRVLLDTARLEEGRLEIMPQPMDMGQFVRELVADLHPLESGHQIEILDAGEPLPISADRIRLDSIVRNLVTNALKYSDEASLITCQLRRADSQVFLSVADRGAGIAADDLPRLFRRFGRVGDSAQRLPGVGLGLFLSRELARLHGGDLQATSQPGQGSTFTLTLPLREGSR